MAEAAEPVAAPDDPGARGRLTVSGTAIEHLARHAALEVDGVVATGGGLDRVVSRRLPRVDVRLAGHRARLQVTVAVAWPVALAEVATAVRDRVAQQVGGLAGIRADAVDVRIGQVVRLDERAGRASGRVR